MKLLREILRTFKSVIRNILFRFRLTTGKLRVLPDFLIIGAQKAGTTSLYNYLEKHPYIWSAYSKEVNFFDLNYTKGINWYKSFFPSKLLKFLINIFTDRKLITGEGSTYYLLHPHVAKRVYNHLPNVKIIVLLRNPIYRTFSGYHHSVNTGLEYLPFNEAIKREEERISQEFEKIKKNGNYKSKLFPGLAYKTRSIYVNQLRSWFEYFPRNQILIIKSEDFFRDPQATLNRVYQFLDIPKWELKEFKKFMAETGQKKIDEEIKTYLSKYFHPYNKELYDLLKNDLGWDN